MELVRTLFLTRGPKFFLSEHICQDPLEKFFGNQRQRGRVNENPTVRDFCKNTQAIRVIGSICRNAVKGNCRGSNKKTALGLTPEDSEPLSKRRRKTCS